MNIDINPEKNTKEIQTLPSQQISKGTKIKRDQTDGDVEPTQKNPHNDSGRAVEEVTGDEGARHESTIESSHTMEDNESLKGDLLIELDKLRNLVISANKSLNLLTDIYQQRSQESLKNGEPVSFEVLKKEYAGNLVKQGKLSKAVSKLRTEVKAQHKTISSLQSELDEYRGPRVDNPWQIGVPYGYRATKISSSTRK